MKTPGNTVAERKIARWGRRAGLAYAERVGDGSGGIVSVREDNHGLRCASLTFGKHERRQTLVQPIRVIRGSVKDGLQRLDRLWVEEEGFQSHRGFVNCTFRKVDILMMLKADDVGASTLGELENRQALAQPIRVIRGSFEDRAAINAAA